MRASTIERASFSSATTRRMSPASGTSARPRTTTAVDGPALVTRLPLGALERPDLAVGLADDDDVADLERARSGRSRWPPGPGPCPARPRRSSRPPARFGLALSSWRSATSRIMSIRSSSPRRALAETWTSGVSPPYSSTMTLASDSSVLTRSGLASGLSILLRAMMIGTLAARAWAIASRVWGITPSSAATTTTAMSVTRAPAGAHRGEGLVTRRVEEDDPPAVRRGDLARPDVLGDPAPLPGGHLGGPDRVEEARLAVVDVTHDGHDRRPRLEERRLVLLEEDLLGRLAGRLLGVGVGDPGGDGHRLGHLVAELAGDERRRVAIDELVDRREDAALDQLPDDVRGVDAAGARPAP